MNLELFEKQNFQTSEVLLIINEKDERLYGFFLGEYTKDKGTFMFLNSAINARQEIVIANMQRIERIYKQIFPASN